MTADTPTLDGWLARLAEPTGDPGGGSAAALMLAVAAALIRMVAGYTTGEDAQAIADRVEALRVELLDAGRADGRVSAALGAALAATGDDRDARVAAAAREATTSSLVLGRLGTSLTRELSGIAEVGNPHLDIDTAVAAEALRAGLAAVALNARENDRLARRHGGSTGSDIDRAALRDALEEVGALAARLDERMQRAG